MIEALSALGAFVWVWGFAVVDAVMAHRWRLRHIEMWLAFLPPAIAMTLGQFSGWVIALALAAGPAYLISMNARKPREIR